MKLNHKPTLFDRLTLPAYVIVVGAILAIGIRCVVFVFAGH